MSGPAKIGVKRKATEDPPDFLVLESHYKNVSSTNLRYVRIQREEDVKHKRPKVEGEELSKEWHEPGVNEHGVEREKRVFRLESQRKRKGGVDSVATFVEREAKIPRRTATDAQAEQKTEVAIAPELPLKLHHEDSAPSTAIDSDPLPPTNDDQRKVQELADYLHEESLEELKREQEALQNAVRETRPRRVVAPKFTASQYAKYRENRPARNSSMRDTEMADDTEFVYDEYILAPTSDFSNDQAKGHGNIGYLIIAEEDESLWQTYLDDEASDKEFETDEDDENAEDYYGADYPEDELASDDEFDRNAYGYRPHGASDDEDGGIDSDDEYDRMMNPFKKTAKQFAKYLEGDDDSD